MKNLRFGFVGVLHLALCFCVVGVFGTKVSAQSTYGSIAGMVTDSSGGVIVDAQVSLTNLATSEKRATFGLWLDPANWGRGRDVSYLTPPARIRTCRIAACGSYRGCVASKRRLG
jgi:hypothetical protein